jgi:peptide-methionine (R)-S-oxide reductase
VIGLGVAACLVSHRSFSLLQPFFRTSLQAELVRAEHRESEEDTYCSLCSPMKAGVCTLAIVALSLGLVVALPQLEGSPDDPPPPACPKSTPPPSGHNKCPLKAPSDPEFESICHPGATGHAGGAENPAYRCPNVSYTEGVFRCACCGAPLFYAKAKFQPQGDGWPAFHGNSSNVNSTVCTPGGTEVVCSKCGSHLGDYFAAGVQSSYSYYCIDGVCLLPPGAEAGKVCEPAPALPTPSKAEAYSALRALMREKGAAAVLGQIDNHDDH